MKLSALANKMQAKRLGPDVTFEGISTDSRAIDSGALFVALTGDRYDGHEYLAKAFEQGASAAMVNRSFHDKSSIEVEQPCLIVEDTRLGLGAAAKAWIQQFNLIKIAITGSCGKTTVKEMVASILSLKGETLATKGNLNNDIGVPLTLARARDHHQFAVIEMGANHSGEIAYTCSLAQPHIALVNNVGPAHLEGFGSLENISRAKAEIYSGLSENGKAIVNLDDEFAAYFLQQTKAFQQVTYSVSNQDADVHLLKLNVLPSGKQRCVISVFDQAVTVELALLGFHNVANALAAIAVAWMAGCEKDNIEQGLNGLTPYAGRMCPVADLKSHWVIDDSYNANPRSVRSAIDILSEIEGDTCLVLGAMAELGDSSELLHEEIGAYAAQRGISTFYAKGEQSVAYRKGYNAYKSETAEFVLASDYEEIANLLREKHPGATVLVKGSRSAAMENVIRCLKEKSEKETY